MKFYHSPASTNCRKVTAVLKHEQLPCDFENVDLAAQANRKPEFLKLNPNAKVPVLVDGELSLWESNAIMIYAASQKASSLWPLSDQRHDITRWLCWELAHFGPAADNIAFENMIKPMMGMGEPDKQEVEKSAGRFKTFAQVLDDHLATRQFVSGSGCTLADLALASHLTFAEPGGIPVESYQHIVRWNRQLDEIPGWRASALQLG